jgi:hypothetical protein
MNWFCSRSASVAKACFMACLFAAGILFASTSSSAAPLIYTAEGGTSVISGTVGSLAFTDATWVLTATADPATVQSGTLAIAESSGAPAYFLPASVMLQITDSVNGSTSMTLFDLPEATWGVISSDYSFLEAGLGIAGFAAINTSPQQWEGVGEFQYATGGSTGGTPGIYTNLGTPGTWLGGGANPPEVGTNLETSLGAMNLSAGSFEFNTGSFTIAPVPEPSTCMMALAGLACGGYSMWRRRKRA